MKVGGSNHTKFRPFAESNLEEVFKDCFSSESARTTEAGEKFIEYFMKNASSDGVLFKTIKEITRDIDIPHQSLSKILKILEDRKLIYRRNGIIGLYNRE